jgi:hypothetical protein
MVDGSRAGGGDAMAPNSSKVARRLRYVKLKGVRSYGGSLRWGAHLGWFSVAGEKATCNGETLASNSSNDARSLYGFLFLDVESAMLRRGYSGAAMATA